MGPLLVDDVEVRNAGCTPLHPLFQLGGVQAGQLRNLRLSDILQCGWLVLRPAARHSNNNHGYWRDNLRAKEYDGHAAHSLPVAADL